MSTQHIVDLLDNGPIGQLDSVQLSSIGVHIVSCEPCRQAYNAALISASLLKESAAEEVQPSPFFKTRVMAALRQRQAAGLVGLAGLWNIARTAVSALIVVTVILLSLTFFGGSQPSDAREGQGVAQAYSMEQVFDDSPLSLNESADVTSGQVLDAVFAGGDVYGNGQ